MLGDEQRGQSPGSDGEKPQTRDVDEEKKQSFRVSQIPQTFAERVKEGNAFLFFLLSFCFRLGNEDEQQGYDGDERRSDVNQQDIVNGCEHYE